MGGEIRVSIDDDEVFERMKRRKAALDLSWEEVVKRGLRDGSGDQVNVDLGRFGGVRIDEGSFGGEFGGEPSSSSGPLPPDFGERLGRHIREQVQQSVGASLGFDEGFDDLSDAEDAVLLFESVASETQRDGGDAADTLDEDVSTQVPLRVNLTTDREGLAVEVVAVRQGKSVAGTNRFPREARRRIAESLAAGETATLRLEADVEEYDVLPVLSWGRTSDGSPTVTDVEIVEVTF